ncbi:hypothetical protein B0J11DRAFT_507372 [Dendryphion nanum]|uniref:Uncharacterized protein n=1 Tax=Dendryphion nanum TaxID=256645 RepID=A0A9P9IJC6_9PLEO|nr:hypothetical protein B0J11DRAFT_507372 [Dendryphion nanum]
MAVCNFEGNGDMYGLGIRLGFYLQWFSGIFANWLAPEEVASIRSSQQLFVAASFLALIISTAVDVTALHHVEIYLVLLLMFGTYLALIPIYIWRILTGHKSMLDPTRWPITRPSTCAKYLNFALLAAVLAFQYWFWFAYVSSLGTSCVQYGFLFSKVQLNSKVSVVLNGLAYCSLGVFILYPYALRIFGFKFQDVNTKELLKQRFSQLRNERDRETLERLLSELQKDVEEFRRRVKLLRNMDVMIKIVAAITVIIATELTIHWNEIDGVDTISGAGQTIPLVIGLGATIRVFYVYMRTAIKLRKRSNDSRASDGLVGELDHPEPIHAVPHLVQSLPTATPQEAVSIQHKSEHSALQHSA